MDQPKLEYAGPRPKELRTRDVWLIATAALAAGVLSGPAAVALAAAALWVSTDWGIASARKAAAALAAVTATLVLVTTLQWLALRRMGERPGMCRPLAQTGLLWTVAWAALIAGGVALIYYLDS